MTLIKGNTYPVRAEMRALGGEFDATTKAWVVPDDKAAEARGLLDVARARTNASRAPRRRAAYSGGSGYQYTDRRGSAHFGRSCGCEDYPCCGH